MTVTTRAKTPLNADSNNNDTTTTSASEDDWFVTIRAHRRFSRPLTQGPATATAQEGDAERRSCRLPQQTDRRVLSKARARDPGQGMMIYVPPPICFSLPFLVVPASCLILSVRLRLSVGNSQSLNLCIVSCRSPFTTLVPICFIQHLYASEVDILRLCI